VKPTREDVKKVIRETISPAFVPFGFANPGISMWRYREEFVDVFHVDMPSYWSDFLPNDFLIDIGCQPRKILRPHPLPYVCIFYNRICCQDINGRFECSFVVQDTIDKEREMLSKATPFILENALTWWSKFSTIEKAIELLVSSSEADLDHITSPRKGSIVFAKNLTILQNLISDQK